MYLEFLYIANDKLAQSELTKTVKLYERITKKSVNISPFGFGFYPSGNVMKVENYDSWEYRPEFLPKPLKMDVFGNDLAEPMYYYMEFLSESSKLSQKKFNHANGFNSISSVRVLSPNADLGTKLKQDLSDFDVLKFKNSQTHILEVTFDGGQQNRSHDFRPNLPLIFNW